MTGDVLVTGGSGFIGGHLTDRLTAAGGRVRVLDRLPPLERGQVDWIEADVRDPAAVARAARGVTRIVHLASVVGVDVLLSDPVEAIDVAVNGTFQVLAAADRERIPLVHLSTSEVLGTNPAVPWAETADRVLGSSLADRWSYGSAKATAEHLVVTWSRSRGIPATVVRPFNVYGPRQEPRFVVAAMVGAALRGDPIQVDGDGRQTRCFTYIDDLVDGLTRVVVDPGRVPIVHLGSEDERSILELAHLVRAAVGGEPPIVHRHAAEGRGGRSPDVPRRIPDATLARTAFGWEATTPLAAGLAEVVSWARSEASSVGTASAALPGS